MPAAEPPPDDDGGVRGDAEEAVAGARQVPVGEHAVVVIGTAVIALLRQVGPRPVLEQRLQEQLAVVDWRGGARVSGRGREVFWDE